MQITKEMLIKFNACSGGVEEFEKFQTTDLKELVEKCSNFSYSNWLLKKLFTKEECVKYAIFAAEKVLHIYESKYPEDKRPRTAIEAAKKYLETKSFAADAAYAAYTAAYAAYTAADATDTAADDAYTAAAYAAYTAADAAYAAYTAAYAAYTAADAAYTAADAAYTAADDAYTAADAIKKEILMFGVDLIYNRDKE